MEKVGFSDALSRSRQPQVSDLKPQFVTCRESASWAGPSGTAVWSTQCLLGLESPHCRGLAGHRPRLWCGCLGFLPAWGTQSGQPTSLVTPAVGRSRSCRPGTSRLPHSAGQSVPTQIQGGFDSTGELPDGTAGSGDKPPTALRESLSVGQHPWVPAHILPLDAQFP